MGIMGLIVCIMLGIVTIYYFIVLLIDRNNKKHNKEMVDDKVVKAMASKIAFDAEKHRENQEKYNYIKSNDDKE